MDPEQYVKDILTRPTKRDKQRTVGASQLGNACTRCLADAMLNVPKGRSQFNQGAIVGTAVHEYLEHRNIDPTAQKELKVELGEIPGYGDIGSTTDLYLPRERTIVDFKTLTRDKLKGFQDAVATKPSEYDTELVSRSRATLEQYFRQAQLYAYGVERGGQPVEQVAIVFICRDGQIVDRDVWAPPTRPYDPDLAKSVMQRAKNLWVFLQSEGDINTLKQDEHCYYCNWVRPSVIEEVEL